MTEDHARQGRAGSRRTDGVAALDAQVENLNRVRKGELLEGPGRGSRERRNELDASARRRDRHGWKWLEQKDRLT